MLPGLRHHALVRCDDEKGHVDPACPHEHILDETLVSGNVDDAYLGTGRQLEPGKPQLDRHAALLLFEQPVRIDPGQGLDQCRFTVVYMTRSAYNKQS